MAKSTLLIQVLVVIQFATLIGMLGSMAWGLAQLFAGRTLLPYRPARTVPWNRFHFFAIAMLWLSINFLVVAVGTSMDGGERSLQETIKAKTLVDPAIDSSPSRGLSPRSIASSMVMVTVANVLLILFIPLVLKLSSGATLSQVGLSTNEFAKNSVLGFRFFLLTTPVIYVVYYFAQLAWPPSPHPIEEMLFKEMSPWVITLAFLSAVIFAPIAEELVFRGVIQGSLIRAFRKLNQGGNNPAREELIQPQKPVEVETQAEVNLDGIESSNDQRSNPLAFPLKANSPHDRAVNLGIHGSSRVAELWAIVVTSAIFAVMHASQMPAPIPLFVLAMILGVLASRTQSLVPSIVLHACFNGFSTVGMLLKIFSTAS